MSAISKINVGGTVYDILGLPVGTIFTSALPQTNSGVHLLDGEYILTTGIYSGFCNLVLSLKVNYPNLLCTEEEYSNDITLTGSCGKFVYNETEKILRLPTITTFIQGLSDLTTLGVAVEAGLPDPKLDVIYRQDSTSSGVYTDKYGQNGYTGSSYSNTSGADEYMQSSLNKTSGDVCTGPLGAEPTNEIYGKSTTVQPSSIRYPYYIVLATVKQTQVEVDINQITTDLNNKISKETIKSYVKETYINGTSGYRIYNDGYCEQWGYITWSDNPVTEIALLKTFADTNYLLFFQDQGTTQDMSNNGISIHTKEKSSFKFNPYDNNRAMNWLAKGYLEEGQY